MIVQPASLGPRSRRRRALGIVGLVLPVVLFVAIVGAGLAGPSPVPEPARTSGPATAAPAVVAVGDRSASPAPSEAALVVFPSSVAGLKVHGVRWTLEARSRGLAGGAIAIAGYLGLDSIPPDCTFCARTGVLGERPWARGPLDETELQPFHLHPQVPIGVRVPYQASQVEDPLAGRSPAVVVIARFDDPSAQRCIPDGRHCGQELVVERVAWINARDTQSTISIDRPLEGTITDAEMRRGAGEAQAAMPLGGSILLTDYVLPATLAQMHPEAADGLPADRAVWYVRGLHAAGDPDRIDWLVFDPAIEEVVATGSVATTRFARTGAAP